MGKNDSSPIEIDSKILTWVLALGVAFVSCAIGWVCWSCIESVQKHAGQMQNFHATPENTKIDSQHMDMVKNTMDSHFATDQLAPSEDLQTLLTDEKSSERVFSKAAAAADSKQYVQAVKYFSQVLAMIPAEAKARTSWSANGQVWEGRHYPEMVHRRRAQIYMILGEYSRAVDDCTAAIKLTPGQSVNYQFRAQAYYKLGRRALGDADTRAAKACVTAYEAHIHGR